MVQAAILLTALIGIFLICKAFLVLPNTGFKRADDVLLGYVTDIGVKDKGFTRAIITQYGPPNKSSARAYVCVTVYFSSEGELPKTNEPIAVSVEGRSYPFRFSQEKDYCWWVKSWKKTISEAVPVIPAKVTACYVSAQVN